MGLINSIVMFFAGVIGAAGLIKDFYPNTANFVERVRKYHLPIGVITFVLGILNLISLIRLGMPMIKWVFLLAISAVMIGLGILLGYPSIQDMFSKNPDLSDGTKAIRDKLWNYQEMLGLAAIVLAVLSLIFGH